MMQFHHLSIHAYIHPPIFHITLRDSSEPRSYLGKDGIYDRGHPGQDGSPLLRTQLGTWRLLKYTTKMCIFMGRACKIAWGSGVNPSVARLCKYVIRCYQLLVTYSVESEGQGCPRQYCSALGCPPITGHTFAHPWIEERLAGEGGGPRSALQPSEPPWYTIVITVMISHFSIPVTPYHVITMVAI